MSITRASRPAPAHLLRRMAARTALCQDELLRGARQSRLDGQAASRRHERKALGNVHPRSPFSAASPLPQSGSYFG